MPLPQIFESVQDHCALLRQKWIGELQVAISSHKQTDRAHIRTGAALKRPWAINRRRFCVFASIGRLDLISRFSRSNLDSTTGSSTR
jgi:hypothetical protein